MKKSLFVVLTVIFLAAGCNKKAAVQAPPPTQTPNVTQNDSGATKQPASSVNVQVNSIDDATNLINKQLTDEQKAAQGGDDVDLTTRDSSELDSYTEVTNESKF